MRPNIVTEAGLPTRMNQLWASVPFITSGVVIICGIIYLVCLLVGYDSFYEVCFLPSEVISRFQVYRIYTSVLFHGSLLHIVFNMLAMVPLGAELERIMGSIRLLFVIVLLATSNAIFHIIIALLISHNPVHPLPYLMDECAIGFSGIIFSMIVIETRLSGVQSRSVFGLFSVPAQWYAWILLILFQFLASNVSLLGHLCGILSGFAYTNGLFNYVLPGPAFFAAIESSSSISACVRRPGFILSIGGNTYGHIPMFSHPTTTSSGLNSGNLWRSLSSWIPRRETPNSEAAQDSRFPGRGRVLGGTPNTATHAESDLSLQARLLDDSLTHPLETSGPVREPHISETRNVARNNEGTGGVVLPNQDHGNFDEELEKLVQMGFEKTRAEVALAAADGDPNVAIEILMSQQG